MQTSSRRVVITGLGVVSPIGIGIEPFWESLIESRSGVGPVQAFGVRRFPTRIASEVRDFEAKKYVKHRKSLKVMARDIQLAVAAAHMAVENADLASDGIDPARIGVSFGAGMICSDLDELGTPISVSQTDGRFDYQKWGREGMEQLFPLWLLKYLPNMLACHISIFHDARGPNNSITAGDASSHLAIGEAAQVIARGAADVFIAGGAESKVNPLGMVRLHLLKSLSTRNDEPARASRPFDLDRDGMVAGEGAGAVIIEELEHAKRRGATIYAELTGFGAASCAAHPWRQQSDGQGVTNALTLALQDSRTPAEQVGAIVAHGLGTREADAAEARGIGRVFEKSPPVTAPKSLFGNLGAGNGAVDLVTTCLSIRNGLIPATANYETPDPECPLDVVHAEPKPLDGPTVLTQSFTLTGQVACLAVKKYEG